MAAHGWKYWRGGMCQRFDGGGSNFISGFAGARRASPWGSRDGGTAKDCSWMTDLGNRWVRGGGRGEVRGLAGQLVAHWVRSGNAANGSASSGMTWVAARRGGASGGTHPWPGLGAGNFGRAGRAGMRNSPDADSTIVDDCERSNSSRPAAEA